MKENKEIEIIRSDRRSISIEVGRDARVKVRAPKNMSDAEISGFISKHSEWLEKKLAQAYCRRDIFFCR